MSTENSSVASVTTSSDSSSTSNHDGRSHSWEKERIFSSDLSISAGSEGILSKEEAIRLAKSMKKTYQWEKPVWAVKPTLRSTDQGEVVKKGADLQAPITHVPKDRIHSVNLVASPSRLKPTLRGSVLKSLGDLIVPVSAVHDESKHDENGVSDRHQISSPKLTAAGITPAALPSVAMDACPNASEAVTRSVEPLRVSEARDVGSSSLKEDGTVSVELSAQSVKEEEETSLSLSKAATDSLVPPCKVNESSTETKSQWDGVAVQTSDVGADEPTTKCEESSPPEKEVSPTNPSFEAVDEPPSVVADELPASKESADQYSPTETACTNSIEHDQASESNAAPGTIENDVLSTDAKPASARCDDELQPNPTADISTAVVAVTSVPSLVPSPSIEVVGPQKKYEWEKPSWAKEPKLRPTTADSSEHSETGESKVGWEKPEWVVQPPLRSTGLGAVVKKGIDLQAPITHVPKSEVRGVNLVASPSRLKPTLRGSDLTSLGDLTLPGVGMLEVNEPDKDVSNENRRDLAPTASDPSTDPPVAIAKIDTPEEITQTVLEASEPADDEAGDEESKMVSVEKSERVGTASVEPIGTTDIVAIATTEQEEPSSPSAVGPFVASSSSEADDESSAVNHTQEQSVAIETADKVDDETENEETSPLQEDIAPMPSISVADPSSQIPDEPLKDSELTTTETISVEPVDRLLINETQDTSATTDATISQASVEHGTGVDSAIPSYAPETAKTQATDAIARPEDSIALSHETSVTQHALTPSEVTPLSVGDTQVEPENEVEVAGGDRSVDDAESPKKYEWEKPSWAKEPKLRPNASAVSANSSDNCETGEGKIGWERPEWAVQPRLRSTDLGAVVKQGVDLQAPITHVPKVTLDDINFEANPLRVLKPSQKGTAVRLGKDLQGPITHVAKDEARSLNLLATPKKLKATLEGSIVKTLGDLRLSMD